jgi:lipoate-protein ligase A
MLAGLEQIAAPVMRWHTIDTPAVLLGMSQQIAQVDGGAALAGGYSVHRRQSGGGIVVSDPSLLMLDLALPHEDPLASSDLTESYRWLGEVLADAMRALGADARVVGIDEARADTRALDALLRRICFAGRSPYEVLVGERKLVGLAQVRRRAGALFQAGVYLRWAPWRTAAVVGVAPEERGALAERLEARVAGLDGRGASAAAVERAVERALRERAGLCPTPGEWRPDELAALEEAATRYAALRPSAEGA